MQNPILTLEKSSDNKVNIPTGDKSNKEFMILSALGILFVVDGHLNGNMFLNFIFPYDSFFMPMFVFISGYFFKEKYIRTFKSTGIFILNKIRKLLIPFIAWVVFYGILTVLLTRVGVIHFDIDKISIVFNNIVTKGTSYGYNDPSWFVPVLFFVCTLYVLIRKLLNNWWNDIVAMVVLALIGAFSVYLSKTDFNVQSNLMWLKAGFFIQFYQFGIIFKKYLELTFDKLNAFALCISLAVINIILMMIYLSKISFPNCAFMSGFSTNNYFLPLITTITGTFFWLKISKCLVTLCGNNKLINLISNNTFFIMTNHLIFKSLFTGFLIIGKKYGVKALSSIDTKWFKSSAWYVYNGQPWCYPAYLIFTIFLTLTSCLLLNRLKILIKSLLNKKNNT